MPDHPRVIKRHHIESRKVNICVLDTKMPSWLLFSALQPYSLQIGM
jgi:hypothetical protein